ncbi:MAG: DnaJ domain-containing protein [Crocinitomicaceae bacterium]|nr:DnaJ domain-containing protein [Crocinitomicaceae bacterium]
MIEFIIKFSFFVMITLFVIIRLLYEKLQEKRVNTAWDKKSFFFGKEYNSDNLMEAHVSLAARMIQLDVEDAGKKVIYMHNYFRRKFRYSEFKFQDALTDCYSNPVDEKLVIKWLNIHISDRSKKMQIMYFLAGLAHVDGSINSREMKMLHSINGLLNLSPKEFQSVIGMYQQRQRRKAQPSSYTKKSALKLACEILGISEQASKDEIKKAYRKLVKIHHPDRFENESQDQQDLAVERFIEIQKAYEVTEEY